MRYNPATYSLVDSSGNQVRRGTLDKSRLDFQANRVVVTQLLRLAEVPEGRYTLKYEISDQISGQKAQARTSFAIKQR